MMTPLLVQIRSEWQRSSLLRWSALAVALIVFFYLWLLGGDLNLDLEAKVADLKGQQTTLVALQNEVFWPDRAQLARSFRVQLESRLWQAETKGLAQANLQSWLERLLRRMQVTRMKLQIETLQRVDGLDDVWQVDALVEGSLGPARMIDLLKEIESHPLLIVIPSFDYERRKFTLQLSTYVQVTGEKL